MKVIPQYNSENIPLSRSEVAKYLLKVKDKFAKLDKTDKEFFTFYEVEFEYDMYGTNKNRYSIVSKENLNNIFNDDKIKNLYYYTDSSKTFFSNVFGALAQSGYDGDSIGNSSLLKGIFGFNVRGALFDNVGYYLGITNENYDENNLSNLKYFHLPDTIINYDIYYNKISENKKFSPFEGYLRYQTDNDWLGLTFGRTQLNQGHGYIDKLYLSDNTSSFDFGKIDINYKAVNYSFAYGSLNGDSVGRPLDAKNIATHYLNVTFSDVFKMGLWEAVIISNQPFSFTYLNPISFLTSADLSSGNEQTTENNAMLGFDFEIVPFKNFSFQSSLLIDDLTFGTLFETDSLNENKFGYQFGALWVNSFNIKNMNFAAEFTHLDPFVYSHRTNKSTYTNNNRSLGHALPPNSDEIAFKINYNVNSRLALNFLYQFQRSGTGIILDSAGKIIANYGGNINFGLGDAYLRTNGFLDGIRINRNIFSGNVLFQPLRQFYFEGQFQYILSDNITNGIELKDFYYNAYIVIEL